MAKEREDFDLLNRRKRFVIGQQQLRTMLHLSEEAQVKAVYTTVDPPAINVIVVHPDYELVHPEAEAPPSFLSMRIISYNPDDGYTYERVELSDD